MALVVIGEGATMFRNEELKDINGIKIETDHVQVTCILKSQDHGEQAGKLKIFADGKLEISCECVPNCPEDKLSPTSFLKHNEKRQVKSWKNRICVIKGNDKRIPLRDTALLKYYYKQKPEEVERVLKRRQTIHHDEFLCCSKCGKYRRFELRSMQECRAYHDALAKENWTCSDCPNNITCETLEERESRRLCRGCPRAAKCKGCISCVCLGCGMCRFKDCSCRTCMEFMENVAN
ncbi:hypothetical protein NMG60_11037124 [Bertholletia excelsa]